MTAQLPHGLAVAEARVRRFVRRGGIDLSALAPNERAALLAEVRSGIAETHVGFRYRCGLCGNEFENDQEMPPACTGPKWTDDHPLEVMSRVES